MNPKTCFFNCRNLSISAVLLLMFAQLHSQTLTLSASADTYINAANASTSYGTVDNFAIKYTTAGSNNRTAWIAFNLPTTLPTSGQILLKLVQISGDLANVTLGSANASFTESATWNSPPTAGTRKFAYGGYRIDNDIYFDITDYVKAVNVAGETKVGIKISSTSLVNSAITFGSRENTNTSLQPKLLFYASQQYDIPLFKITEDVQVTTKGITYNTDKLGSHNYTENLGSYLGWTGAKSNATGFFRTAKDCDGVWNIFDPEGNMFYSAGLNSIEQGGGISFPSSLTNLGLNTAGNFSDETLTNTPFCPRLNFMANFKDTSTSIKDDYKADIMPVFEPSFVSFCTSWAVSSTATYKNNKWVLGYFMDNELNFHKTQLVSSLGLSTSNAQYKAADAWMKVKYGNSYSKSSITATDELDYMGYVIETYYRVVYTALKAADPNHLVLGTRFHSSVKYTAQTFTAIKNYVDIISVNYYGDFEPEPDYMAMWLANSGKPFIVSEFYVKGDDLGMGNEEGAGWTVTDQKERGYWFENWMLNLLKNKGNVGFHWFRYIDNKDSNQGLYSATYQPYTLLAESFKAICISKYRLRSHVLYGNSNYNGVVDCDQVVCGSNMSCYPTLAIDAKSYSESVLIYPNPVKNTLRITFESQSFSSKSIEILTVLGQVVKKQNTNSFQDTTEIDTSKLTDGVYLIKISDQNDGVLLTKKIVISR